MRWPDLVHLRHICYAGDRYDIDSGPPNKYVRQAFSTMPIIPPKDITKTQFEDALNQYAATFARISAKSVTPSTARLSFVVADPASTILNHDIGKSASHFRELDKFRYIEGPQRLSKRIQIAAFKLEDVIKLVEWKL